MRARQDLHSTTGRRRIQGYTRAGWEQKGALPLFLLLCGVTFTGCSVKGMAVNGLADALSSGGSSVYLQDDDPQLVGQALPFSLKLMETVLQETPEHRGLLVATASAFVLYTHAYVSRPAQVLESTDLPAARRELARAKALFLRAKRYAGRALELSHPGIEESLETNPEVPLGTLSKEDVPAMYWYAAALGSAVSSDKNDMSLVAAFPAVPALLRRALKLDEDWSDGAIHELMVTVAAAEGEEGKELAEGHFRRAMELNGGRSVGPLVALAEAVCVPEQERERFTRLLTQVLAFDVDRHPETRLSNILAQQRAAWLLERADMLFFSAPAPVSEDRQRKEAD